MNGKLLPRNLFITFWVNKYSKRLGKIRCITVFLQKVQKLETVHKA